METTVSYPIPSYRYMVSVGEESMAFQSVSGLEMDVPTIEYKDGIGGIFRMPETNQTVNVKLSRGIAQGQGQLYDWINSINSGQIEGRDISISLTNETGSEILVTWNLSAAIPTHLSASSFDASSNAVSIEALCLSANHLTVAFA